MNSFYSVYNQTMTDLCLQAYGTTDLLVKFCTDNNITSINYIPPVPQLFVYDEALVTDQQLNNYVFVTGNIANIDEEYYESEGGGTYGSEDGGDYYIPD